MTNTPHPSQKIAPKPMGRTKKAKNSPASAETPAGKRSKKKRLKKILKILGIIVAVFAFLGLAATAGLFIYYAKDLPNPQKLLSRNVAETTKIYDRTGQKVLYEIHGDQNRTLVSIKDIPDSMKHATVSVEDAGFYQHKGFDIKGIIRAFITDFILHKTAQGGSTITQQLIKTTILSPEKTISRKIKELILAIEIERKFSKDQILQMYMNEIPYGSGAYGIYEASETFFNKQPKDLTISESALLASLPKAPTYYSPYGSHTDDLESRHQWAIGRMEELGYITHDQAEEARKQKLVFANHNDANIIAPHFVFYLREQLEAKYGSKTLEQGGLKIISTLDYNMQLMAEKAVTDNMDKVKKWGGDNAALVAVDPKRGEILAMVGSKDYFNTADQGNVNAADRPLQPGSSFKPYVYATALAKGFTPDTVLYDLDTDFGHGYKPVDFDHQNRGPVRLKNALAESLNIPAVKVGYIVDPAAAAATARNMGVENLKEGDFYGLSTALGAKEITLVDHTGAFGVFANQGKKIPKTGILKITDNKGNVLEENKPEKTGVQVIDANVANTINSILSDNTLRAPIFGAHTPLVLSRPAAAKTGTTNDFNDAWTVGYTPNLVAGVWTGNTDGHQMKSGADGVFVAAPIWHQFMEDALKNLPVENFVKPSPIDSKNPYLKGSQEVAKDVKLCKPSMKLATEACPPDMIVTKTYKSAHSELYYIDRTNISGPPPTTPQKDPLFNNFEGPVLAWAKKNGETIDQIPTENDTTHNADQWPKVTISSPNANDVITSATFQVKASITAPQGMGSADFYIDKTLFYHDTKSPWNATLNATNVDNGFHALRVRVTDAAGNIGDTSITINLNITKQSPTVTLSSPVSGTTISTADFPYALLAQVQYMSDISEVRFYYKDAITGNSIIIGSVTSPTASGQYSAQWASSPGPGAYSLYANGINSAGDVIRSNTVSVTIQ